MFRLTLILCAVVMAHSGVVALFTGLPGWPLVLAAVLIVCSEPVFSWLKKMGRK